MNMRISNTLFDLASLVGHTLNGLGQERGVARLVDITNILIVRYKHVSFKKFFLEVAL